MTVICEGDMCGYDERVRLQSRMGQYDEMRISEVSVEGNN